MRRGRNSAGIFDLRSRADEETYGYSLETPTLHASFLMRDRSLEDTHAALISQIAGILPDVSSG